MSALDNFVPITSNVISYRLTLNQHGDAYLQFVFTVFIPSRDVRKEEDFLQDQSALTKMHVVANSKFPSIHKTFTGEVSSRIYESRFTSSSPSFVIS